MTYDQAIAFWFGRINYEQTSPRPSDLKLDRMRSLLELLDNPQEKYGIVHIAGSKGKGSTSAMLACVLQRAGYRTGLFTSPHLERVEERIQVDNVPISAVELAGLVAEVAHAVGRLDQQAPVGPEVTFFEIATAVGFLHFARRGVELAVIEVGLGGRFDSTNVCRPLVSIITSISYDHTEILGNTLASIAREKAGIIKPGRPVISGAQDSGARAVIEQTCRERRSTLRQLGVDFSYEYEPACIGAGKDRPSRVQVATGRRHWPTMALGLLGEHQAANAALVVSAVELLKEAGLKIALEAVAGGLDGVHWPARLEVIACRPLVVLDCAHNLASAQALIDTLRDSFGLEPGTKRRRRLLILAGNRDKDLSGMLQLLAPNFSHLFLTRFANNPRSVPPAKLAKYLTGAGHHHAERDDYTLCGSSENAWQLALRRAGPEDLICVTGSVFLAGELRPLLLKKPASG